MQRNQSLFIPSTSQTFHHSEGIARPSAFGDGVYGLS